MTQQEQAKQYFRSAATDWQNKSVNASGGYSVIEGRNRAVLNVVSRTKNVSRFLDVGCGTGQLVIAVAQRGTHGAGASGALAARSYRLLAFGYGLALLQSCEVSHWV
jgi:2-polyprenyl-3-methyl-5-hydroxy-6-metoxy-1,4-benzoquinol methylase